MDAFERVFVVGAGKAGAAMAAAVERVLGRRIAGGVVNVPDGAVARLRRIRLNAAGHPIPDERGVAGASQIAAIARAAGARDLIIALISGGASALLPLPAPGVSLHDKRQLTAALLRAGATIHELNTVRKHLSAIKGGHLAALAQPARLITLIVSDVVGDDLDVIGSGPTVADRSTVSDARAILARYGMRAPRLQETPKSALNAQNVVVCSNRAAIAAAAQKARELGYHAWVLSTAIQGEARDAAAAHVALARQVLAAGRPVRRPACILSGGETTVTVRGTGRGGRNQEFVLAAAIALNGAPGVTVFSAGTDGIDGPTDAAGAIADERTFRRAAAAGLDPRAALDENDSYTFFAGVDGLVKTGPTGTNVMDLRLLLIV